MKNMNIKARLARLERATPKGDMGRLSDDEIDQCILAVRFAIVDDPDATEADRQEALAAINGLERPNLSPRAQAYLASHSI